MKYALSFVLFASALLAVIHAYPGKRASDSEVDLELDKVGPIIVLSEVTDPLEDGFFGGIRENPFNGLFSRMQDMMKRFRQQIAENLPRYPGQGSFFGFSNIPDGANTTSTTKVIDGHVVTVNETTYSEGDDVQGTVVRVRIVDIQPEDGGIIGNPDAEEVTTTIDEEDTSTQTNTDRSVESVENIVDNEIPERLVQITPV